MREVVLRVPGRAVEDVLDRLLPIVPGGVREVRSGRHVELRMRGAELPDARGDSEGGRPLAAPTVGARGLRRLARSDASMTTSRT